MDNTSNNNIKTFNYDSINKNTIILGENATPKQTIKQQTNQKRTQQNQTDQQKQELLKHKTNNRLNNTKKQLIIILLITLAIFLTTIGIMADIPFCTITGIIILIIIVSLIIIKNVLNKENNTPSPQEVKQYQQDLLDTLRGYGLTNQIKPEWIQEATNSYANNQTIINTKEE